MAHSYGEPPGEPPVPRTSRAWRWSLLLLAYPTPSAEPAGELGVAHFPRLHTPALFVHGTVDPFASVAELRSALAAIPARRQLHLEPGVGHDLGASRRVAPGAARPGRARRRAVARARGLTVPGEAAVCTRAGGPASRSRPRAKTLVSSSAMTIHERVERLPERARKEGLAAFLVPRADEHQGEYVPPRAQRLGWISGFTGSAGPGGDRAGRARRSSCDGRYTLQVRDETPETSSRITT